MDATEVAAFRKQVKQHIFICLVALLGAFLAVRTVRRVVREIRYERALSAYSGILKAGMTRIDVESSIKLNHPDARIEQMCCEPGQPHAMADIVQIAEEKPSWPCIGQNIYVAFEFTPTEPLRSDKDSQGTDRFVRVSLFRSVCLDLP